MPAVAGLERQHRASGEEQGRLTVRRGGGAGHDQGVMDAIEPPCEHDQGQAVLIAHAVASWAERSMMLGWLPHSGHSGSGFTRTLWKLVFSALYISRLPDR